MADTGFGVGITFETSGFTAEILNVDGPNMSREPVETSHSATTGGKKTFIPSDMVDHGEVELEINFDPDEEPPIDAAAETITITFPIPAGSSSGAKWAFTGFVTAYSPGIPIEDRMTATVTIKVSGDITYTAAA